MAKLNYVYNVDQLPESEQMDFSPLPAGWYTAEIKSAELKTTNAGTGQYIKLRFDILQDGYTGRVVFSNLNISNPNSKAQEIGLRQLGDMLRSIGLPSIEDTDQLIGHVLRIKLKIRKSDEYGDSNDVTGFKALVGSAPPPVFPSAVPAPVQSQQAPQERITHVTQSNGKPPWAK